MKVKTNTPPFTIRDLAKIHPEMWDYHYSWRNTESPELEKNMEDILNYYGFTFKDRNDEDLNYNDIKGYLNCELRPLRDL